MPKSMRLPIWLVVLVGYSLKKLLRDYVSIAPFGVTDIIESLSLGLVGSCILDLGSISSAIAYILLA
jgi:hypothetical protein